MRFSMLYSGEQILSFKSWLVFYAGDSLKKYTTSQTPLPPTPSSLRLQVFLFRDFRSWRNTELVSMSTLNTELLGTPAPLLSPPYISGYRCFCSERDFRSWRNTQQVSMSTLNTEPFKQPPHPPSWYSIYVSCYRCFCSERDFRSWQNTQQVRALQTPPPPTSPQLIEYICIWLQVFLFRERLQKLKKYTASQYEYLKLRDKEGIVTHKRGYVHSYLFLHKSMCFIN